MKWIARPMIPIKIHGPSGSVAFDALIDSGADRSLFHVTIGRRIGIPPDTGAPEIFSGIEAGQLMARLHQVRVEILGIPGSTQVTAGFVDAPGVFAILGQDGFFDSYRIKFEKDHNTFEVNPVR